MTFATSQSFRWLLAFGHFLLVFLAFSADWQFTNITTAGKLTIRSYPEHELLVVTYVNTMF